MGSVGGPLPRAAEIRRDLARLRDALRLTGSDQMLDYMAGEIAADVEHGDYEWPEPKARKRKAKGVGDG